MSTRKYRNSQPELRKEDFIDNGNHEGCGGGGWGETSKELDETSRIIDIIELRR